ncbi:hypothetical protein [uncultured Treponema sp.]|uniref:hypothetical protein n=1 Tax=uncultured Treponema sp. TaxID=162155 RepID=UPI0025F6DA4F|nr:hypothetical protein [uncultured Treponema sp.]
MTATVTIQNANKTLIDAIKSLVKLSPSAHLSIKKTAKDDFYNEENIRHLEELKRLDDEGKLKFTKHDLIEV